MAEADQQETGVNLSTGLFTLGLKGGNALFFFLLLMLGLNIGLTLYEHVLRSKEHDQIECSTKLAIFIYTTPRNMQTGVVDIAWDRLPVDLFGCLPTFLYKAR